MNLKFCFLFVISALQLHKIVHAASIPVTGEEAGPFGGPNCDHKGHDDDNGSVSYTAATTNIILVLFVILANEAQIFF